MFIYVFINYLVVYIIFLGTLKNNIDKLIEELRFVIKSEKEIEDIIQILDSIVDISKTSFGGIKYFFLSYLI